MAYLGFVSSGKKEANTHGMSMLQDTGMLGREAIQRRREGGGQEEQSIANQWHAGRRKKTGGGKSPGDREAKSTRDVYYYHSCLIL